MVLISLAMADGTQQGGKYSAGNLQYLLRKKVGKHDGQQTIANVYSRVPS